MLDVRRLPSALVAATFALSGVVATTGVTSVALGVGSADAPICPGLDEEHLAGGILDCLGPSTVYVQTSLGSGSGLVLPDGYVLTNAHVVDPFTQVKVTLADDEVHEAVPVVGVDLFADIAVLGPIETDVTPVTLIDPAELQEGDDLFLVGYPGERTADDLKPTIADGILSRTRHSKVFDLSYLQTDASIGGGQSGGALVDAQGAVVGISSLRFAENFALALSGKDAQRAVDGIVDQKGSAYQAWPGGAAAPQNSLHLDDDDDVALIGIPEAAEERTIDVTVPADLPLIMVTSAMEGDEDEIQSAANFAAVAAEELDVPLSAVQGVSQDELREFIEDEGGDYAEVLAPGSFRFRVPADQHVFVAFLTNREAAVDIPVTTSIPVAAVVPEASQPLKVGDGVFGTVGSLVPYDEFTIDLAEGQAVEIYAASPAGDMRVELHPPGDDDYEEFDDSNVGLYGVDVQETYTAPAAGTYVIQVGQVSDTATGYRFEIREPKPA